MNRKIQVLSLFVLCLTYSIVGRADTSNIKPKIIKANSKITQAVVYMDKGFITRETELSLDKGEYTIVFSDLPHQLEDSSIRAKIRGNDGALIKGLSSLEEDNSTSETSKSFNDSLEKINQINKEILKVKDDIMILEKEKSYLISLFETAPPFDKEGDDFGKFNSYSEFIKQKLEVNSKSLRDKNKDLEELKEKISELKENIPNVNQISNKQILVGVNMPSSSSVVISIDYLIKSAGWKARYDIRLSKETQQARLTYYGVLYQKTGEDWNNVKLIFSSGQPNIGASPPQLTPWLINPNNAKVNIPANDYSSSTSMPELNLSENWNQRDKDNKDDQPATSNITSVFFHINDKVSIPSSSGKHNIIIMSKDIPAEFSFEAVPKLNSYAFLKARMQNIFQQPMFSGSANIFFNKDFVGTANINNVAPSEFFDAYLGADKDIKVVRKREKKLVETKGGFLSSLKKRITYEYVIIIENNKKENININVTDQLPVPQDENIYIETIEILPAPSVNDYNNSMGWSLELTPNSKETINIKFLVEFPANLKVKGLE